jgi:hypothetical protein
MLFRVIIGCAYHGPGPGPEESRWRWLAGWRGRACRCESETGRVVVVDNKEQWMAVIGCCLFIWCFVLRCGDVGWG